MLPWRGRTSRDHPWPCLERRSSFKLAPEACLHPGLRKANLPRGSLILLRPMAPVAAGSSRPRLSRSSGFWARVCGTLALLGRSSPSERAETTLWRQDEHCAARAFRSGTRASSKPAQLGSGAASPRGAPTIIAPLVRRVPVRTQARCDSPVGKSRIKERAVSLTQAFDERDSHYWVTGRCIASLRRSVGESSLEQRP